MKTSTLFAWLFAAVSMLTMGADAATAAPGEPQKLQANFVFIINCTPQGPDKAGDNVHFEIVVVSRTGKFSPDAEGLLEVFDPKGNIFSGDLQYKVEGQTLKYEFDLSPKYLTKSRFSFKCTGVDAKGAATADVLWVSLLDYVNPSLR